MLITDVQVAGLPRLVDVRCVEGRIAEVGPCLRRSAHDTVLAGAGAALLPGLHDHHIHLLALAALRNSVQCGPPDVSDRAQLERALRAGHASGWLRGVGYHESVAGDLDRRQLDRIRSDRPLKIQHRSGKLWIVNSLAAQLLSLDENAGLPGIELDATGRPSGRLFWLDGWMREQLAQSGPVSMPSLAGVSRLLASFGVTGVTDATPDNDRFAMAHFTSAAASGELLQAVRVMGNQVLPESGCAQVQRAERKVMLDENTLPDWDDLLVVFETAHRQGRPVAVHCVTPAELVLTLSVLREVGPHPGDRIEHCSLVPNEILPLLREVGVRVITQPGFIHERGDQYLHGVAPAEHGELYRCNTLLVHGIRLAGSTDAPYGNPDPWAAMRAAVDRRSRAGIALGQAEQLSPEQALALFTSAADDPGGASRTIAVGEVADLCLLNCTWQEARLRLCSADVRATLRDGTLIFEQDRQVMTRRQDAAVVA
jgi:predicted amidohydrolase YtcJ